MKASQVLAGARHELETHGHTKRQLQGEDGSHCAMAALVLNGAKQDGHALNRAQRFLVDAIPEDGLPYILRNAGSIFMKITGYNDAARTSAEDVMLWFKRAEEYACQAGD